MRRVLNILAIAAGVLVLALAVGGAAGAKAPKPPPPTFFGVDAWSNPSSHEFGRMGHGNVGTYRFLLNWSTVESCPGCRNWQTYDKAIGDAARHGVRTLPFVWASPSFLEKQPRFPPLGKTPLKAYTRFVGDVVKRYGTAGTFWAAHPELPKEPIAGLQVWNEPSHPAFWSNNRKASDYVKLLRAAAQAIRSADSGTKVVLAGIPNVGGKALTDYISDLYHVSGFRQAFDVMAIHPYAINAQAIYDTMDRVRSIMSANGDGKKQTWITETGWASTKKKYFAPFAGSPKGQATILSQLYNGLIQRKKQYRLGMVVWFAWRDRKLSHGEKNGWVTHTGLFQVNGKPKPAWKALVKISGGKPGSGSL